MHGVVFRASVSLEVVLVVALHTQHGLNAQNACQIRVLAASLLTASPARVTEDVHIGAPECQFGVARVVGHAHRHVEQRRIAVVGAVPVGAGLVRHRREHVVEQFGAERSGHTDRLRINRVAFLTHAVARFRPPVVRRNAQSVNRHRLVHH